MNILQPEGHRCRKCGNLVPDEKAKYYGYRRDLILCEDCEAKKMPWKPWQKHS